MALTHSTQLIRNMSRKCANICVVDGLFRGIRYFVQSKPTMFQCGPNKIAFVLLTTFWNQNHWKSFVFQFHITWKLSNWPAVDLARKFIAFESCCYAYFVVWVYSKILPEIIVETYRPPNPGTASAMSKAKRWCMIISSYCRYLVSIV